MDDIILMCPFSGFKVNSELIRIENGYSSCAGLTDSGWYAGALVIDDVDGPYLSAPDLDYDGARENCLDWQRAVAGVVRGVVSVDGNSLQQNQIASAAPTQATTPTASTRSLVLGEGHVSAGVGRAGMSRRSTMSPPGRCISGRPAVGSNATHPTPSK